MSFVQAIYLLSLTDSEVLFTARACFPKSFQALCSLVCKNLDWDVLELLLVWVDKENLIELLLNFLYYLYNYYMVCALSSHSSHVT